MPARPAVPELERIAARLRDRCGAVSFGAPVAFTYNPLDSAWEAHRAFLRMARPRPRVLFVGMNPGPFGMAQTGVPFGLVLCPMAEVLPGEYPPPIVNLGEMGKAFQHHCFSSVPYIR